MLSCISFCEDNDVICLVIEPIDHSEPAAVRDEETASVLVQTQTTDDIMMLARQQQLQGRSEEPLQLSNKVHVISFRSGKGEWMVATWSLTTWSLLNLRSTSWTRRLCAWRQNNDLGRIGRSVRSLTWMSDSWSCEPSFARPPSSSWLAPWLNLPPKRSGRLQAQVQVIWLTRVVEILGDALLALGLNDTCHWGHWAAYRKRDVRCRFVECKAGSQWE